MDRYQCLWQNTVVSNSMINTDNYIPDVPDLALIQRCGLGIAVNDAHPAVQQGADYITRCVGGHGAVREVCDLLLLANGQLRQAEGISL